MITLAKLLFWILPNEVKVQLLVLLLNALKWGPDNPVPPPVFDAICGAFTTTGCELMVLRRTPQGAGHTGAYEVLLIERPGHDKYYAGMMHGPGSIRCGHERDDTILARILRKELDGVQTTVIRHVGYNLFRPKRGQELTKLHVTLVLGRYTGQGQWFPLDQLPDNILEHHRILVGQIREWLAGHNGQFPYE